MPSLLKSKKFGTLFLGILALVAETLLDMPADLVQSTMALFITALSGFAVQDYGKARDALSDVELGRLQGNINSLLNTSKDTNGEVILEATGAHAKAGE